MEREGLRRLKVRCSSPPGHTCDRSPALSCGAESGSGVPGKQQWGRPPSASSFYRCQRLVLWRPEPGQGRYGNTGPLQSQPAGPAPSCGDCELAGPRMGKAADPPATRPAEGQWRSSAGSCTSLVPKAGGRARETSYPGAWPRCAREVRLSSCPGFPMANTTPEPGRKGSQAFLPN